MNGPYTGASTPRATRAHPPTLCVLGPRRANPLRESTPASRRGRHPDRVLGTVKARSLAQPCCPACGRLGLDSGSARALASGSCPSMGHSDVAVDTWSESRFFSWPSRCCRGRPRRSHCRRWPNPRSEHLTRRVPSAGDAWTHSLCVSAPPVERTICSALGRTVRRPSFTGRIALFRHRLSRTRFSAAMGLIRIWFPSLV